MESIKYYNGRARSYYEIVTAVAIRNVKLRYKNSILGFLWSLLNPLIYLSIFVFIFNNAFPDIENYPLYALTGLIFWTYFSATSIQLLTSVVDSGGILKSLSVPPIIFPLSFLFSSLVNLVLSFIPFTILMFFFGFNPGIESLLVIPGLIFFSIFIFGFSLILCSFNVYFRDVAMFYNTVMPALFYMTPIAYSFELVPGKMSFIIKLNPLFHFVKFFRDVLYYNKIPDQITLIAVILISIIFGVIGVVTFYKLKKGFISHL